jgi:hypothetical protein
MKLKPEDLKKIIMEEVIKVLDEVSPEDETMIFKQMIRDVAQDIIVTHKKLSSTQQEAYENLLIQAGNALAEKESKKKSSNNSPGCRLLKRREYHLGESK